MQNYINNSNMPNFYSAQPTSSTAQSQNERSTNTDNDDDHNWASIENLGLNETGRNNNGNDLDKDAFLKLLMAQLQYQDPLSPMENTDFIAQLAQFSSLEQMQNMNSNTIRTQAFNMIGSEVLADVYNEQTNTSQQVIGHVEGVVIRNGEPLLSINGKNVPMSDVTAVSLDPTLEMLTGINNQLFTSQNVDIIGQYAQFLERDKEGDMIRFVEGKIDSIKFTEKGPMAVIGSEEISAGNLQTISPTPLLIGRVITGTNSDDVIITNPIKNVLVINGKINLVLEDGNILVDNVTHVTDAFRHVKTEITHEGTTGIVESVKIIRGVPYLVLEDGKEISYLDFAGIKDDDDDE